MQHIRYREFSGERDDLRARRVVTEALVAFLEFHSDPLPVELLRRLKGHAVLILGGRFHVSSFPNALIEFCLKAARLFPFILFLLLLGVVASALLDTAAALRPQRASWLRHNSSTQRCSRCDVVYYVARSHEGHRVRS